MKRSVSIVLAIALVLGIVLASNPLQAQAKPNPTPTPANISPLIAGGSWSTGSTTDVAAFTASAPSWLQLLAGGVKVTEEGKICHPFRGGQFGWVGQIMQYKESKWVKLETVNDWVPNKEGEFLSCAQAPAAGTYALFGYWKRPAGYVDPIQTVCNYSTEGWSRSFDNLHEDGRFNLYVSDLPFPDGTVLTFSVDLLGDGVNVKDGDTDLIDVTTETAIVNSGSVSFTSHITFSGSGNLTYTLSALGCSRQFETVSG